jgi:hypothetical protein
VLKIGNDFTTSFSTSIDALSDKLIDIGEKFTWTDPQVEELSDRFKRNKLSEFLFS